MHRCGSWVPPTFLAALVGLQAAFLQRELRLGKQPQGRRGQGDTGQVAIEASWH